MPERPRRAAAPVAAAPVAAVLAVVLALVLGGCASIPTSGPVRAGAVAGGGQQPGFRVAPAPPAAGAAPDAVVRGFLLAGVEVEDEFATARQYLSTGRRGTWQPTTRTVVRAEGADAMTVAVSSAAAPGQAVVDVTVDVTGSVDEHGRYAAAAPGASESFSVVLVREDEEWRIAEVPDLLLVAEPDFLRTFRARSLYFAAGSDGHLVPEVRWFADRPASATALVTELLAGPSPWLAPAVTTGAAPGSTLGRRGSVAVTEREARVDLPQALVDADTADPALLRRQLQATLQALPGVGAVRVTVDGGELDDAGEAAVVEPAVDAAPVLVRDGSLVRLRDGALTPVEGLPALDGLGASDPAVLGGTYAVLAAGRTQLLVLERDQEEAPRVVLTAAQLTAPSLDRAGWVWSTSRASVGTVTAVGPEGDVAEVAATWLAGRTVQSLRASRDGARVVVVSSGADAAVGGAQSVRVDLAAVVRDGEDAPRELSVEPGTPTPWLAAATAAVWVDATTVAVLGVPAPGSSQGAAGTPQVLLLTGGRARSLGAPVEATEPVRLAAGSGPRTILVGTADGALWQRAGSRWVAVAGASGAVDPAYAG